MKRFCSQVLLAGMLTIPAFAGTVTFLTTPLATVDNFNWSGIGGDGTTFNNNQTAASGLGNVVTIGLGTQPVLGGLTSVVCTAAAPANCSWGHQVSGYSAGDTLIWAEGLDSNSAPVGTGPVTLSLQNGVGGLGAYLQTTSTGAFVVSFSVFNGATLLGSHSYSSDVAGDPLFVGARDNTAGDITKALLSVTSCGSFRCDVNDFSVDTLQVFAASTVTSTPEPTTFALGGSLMALGLSVYSRLRKGNS